MALKKKTNIGLIISIVFASTVFSASLVFFGMQLGGYGMSDEKFAEKVETAIEAYAQKMQEQYDAGLAGANVPKVVDGDYSDDDAVLGDPKAPLSLVEFSDFECPFCESFYTNTLPQIKEKYIDTGKINLVYRDYPLSFHAGAKPSALAAECARDQADDAMYYKMHDVIFENQSKLSGGRDVMMGFASQLGLDMAKFTKCYDDDKFGDEIDADMADGQAAGVGGTPGFVFNGKLIEGAQPFSVFEEAIEEALAQ